MRQSPPPNPSPMHTQEKHWADTSGGHPTVSCPGCPRTIWVTKNEENEERSQPKAAQGNVITNVMWGPGRNPGAEKTFSEHKGNLSHCASTGKQVLLWELCYL
jgi:hypothetical protein